MEYIILDAQSDLLKEIKRYNNIKEKELELNREMFEFNKKLREKDTEANLMVAKATENMSKRLENFQINMNMIATNQVALFDKFINLEDKLKSKEE